MLKAKQNLVLKLSIITKVLNIRHTDIMIVISLPNDIPNITQIGELVFIFFEIIPPFR